MSWRTVIINTRCKLDLKMGYMVVRGEDTKRIFLDEIAMVLIENPAVSLTGCLLEALIEKKIKVIFCDSKRSPMAELVPYYGSHDCSRRLKFQIAWTNDIKGEVWKAIVFDKISKQSEFLLDLNKEKEASLLNLYLSQIEHHDKTNREGHAAKVYFNAVFGMDFTRDLSIPTNAALNYGYGVLLSAFNREISSSGYFTQLGIFHSNIYNYFNLSCDLMEPFRVLIDRCVKNMDLSEFNNQDKYLLWNVLNQYVLIGGTKQTVSNAIKIYTKTIFDSLNEQDPSKIKFYSNPEKI